MIHEMAVNERSRTMSVNEQEWAALVDAEAAMYAGEHGAHAYTSVNDRSDHDPLLDVMFQHAAVNAEAVEDYDEQELIEEAARRVASALAILAFGAEYGAELAAKATV